MISERFKEAPRGKSGRSSGCSICGNHTEVQIAIMVMDKSDGWLRNESGYTAQRSVSLCEDHALEAWTRLNHILMEFRR